MMKLFRTLPGMVIMLLMTLSLAHGEEVERIVLWSDVQHAKEALEVILDETVHDHGPYEIVPSGDMAEGRAVASLQGEAGVDIISASATKEFHNSLLPLNIPSHPKFLGYRVMLVRKEEANLFKGVTSLEDLQEMNLHFGSGMHWIDTQILMHNGLDVVTAAVPDQLMPMLEGGRFDAYPRGVGEVFRNLEDAAEGREELGIVVEPHLVLVYPFRDVFYLNRKDYRLRARLHTGFQRARESGAWDRYLEKRLDEVLSDIKVLKLSGRTVIRLENPFFPEVAGDIPLEFDPLEPGSYPE